MRVIKLQRNLAYIEVARACALLGKTKFASLRLHRKHSLISIKLFGVSSGDRCSYCFVSRELNVNDNKNLKARGDLTSERKLPSREGKRLNWKPLWKFLENWNKGVDPRVANTRLSFHRLPSYDNKTAFKGFQRNDHQSMLHEKLP